MISGNVLPWRRCWTPANGTVSVGHDGRGFLDDPEDELGQYQNPGLLGLEELLSRRCIVLSGQPGIGKTTEVDTLCEKSAEWLESDECLINFSGRLLHSPEELRRRTVESADWRAALARGGRIRLLIDALDEALRRVSLLVPILTDALAREPIERIRAILVCRSAEWHLADGHALAALWGEDAESLVFELCPLRLKDAELAARMSGVDAAAFLREVTRHQAKGLAA